MKRIYLSGKSGADKFTFVDDDDYERLSAFKWYAHSRGYAQANINSRAVLMHRMVANTPPLMHTDHINHDRLDNRKENLRVCDRFINMQNKARQGYVNMLPVRRGTKVYRYWVIRFQKYRVIYASKCYKSQAEAVEVLQAIRDGLVTIDLKKVHTLKLKQK